jgi:hypothetical protein
MAFLERPSSDGTVEVEMASGQKLLCVVCRNDKFHERNALLNTRIATLFKFDWANREATNFVCASCDYVHWFLPK